MQFLIHVDPGLEAVAADEVCDVLPRAVVEVRPLGLDGRVGVACDDLDALLALRTIRRVVEVRRIGRVGTLDDIRAALANAVFEELRGAASFRVTSTCDAPSGLDPRLVAGAAGAVLQAKYGTPVDLTGFALEIRVDVQRDRLVAGVQRTRECLSKRLRRGASLRSALRPTTAAAMIRLVGAHRGTGRLVDPLCGVGTIPVEALAINPGLDVTASDWDGRTAEAARRTFVHHDLDLDVSVADARKLGRRRPGEFDYIVTDPPYGMRQARHTSLTSLYRALLRSFALALAPSGRVAIVVVKYRVFLAALEGSGLTVLDECPVDGSSVQSRIFVLALDSGTTPRADTGDRHA